MLEQTISETNLRLALVAACRHRCRRRAFRRQIAEFLSDPDGNLAVVARDMAAGEWAPRYRTFTRTEHGKTRRIDWDPSFRDGVIQHALHQVAGRVLERSCIIDTYSGFRGRGGLFGKRRMEKFLRMFGDGPVHALKGDIRHYYPSIDVGRLKDRIHGKIKDRGVLRLLDILLDSHPDGLPIGSFLSQTLANFYLSPMDHMVKEELRCRCYARYCDDFVVLDSSRERLAEVRDRIASWLAGEGLELKAGVQTFPVGRRGIDFMGYVFRRTTVRLRKRIERRLRRAARLYGLRPDMRHYNTLASYWGWCRHLPKGEVLWNSVAGRPLSDLLKEASNG
jgi:hypothetical protein